MNENTWLDLQHTPLNTEKALAFVNDPAAGGIDIFLGTTRAEKNTAGQDLIALEYEAYESMARKQLAALADYACTHWPVTRLVILHRLGQVFVSEPSVLIAVSTPHRAASFDACRWIIDQLKKETAIWKKEIWDGADSTWVHPNIPQM